MFWGVLYSFIVLLFNFYFFYFFCVKKDTLILCSKLSCMSLYLPRHCAPPPFIPQKIRHKSLDYFTKSSMSPAKPMLCSVHSSSFSPFFVLGCLGCLDFTLYTRKCVRRKYVVFGRLWFKIYFWRLSLFNSFVWCLSTSIGRCKRIELQKSVFNWANYKRANHY